MGSRAWVIALPCGRGVLALVQMVVRAGKDSLVERISRQKIISYPLLRRRSRREVEPQVRLAGADAHRWLISSGRHGGIELARSGEHGHFAGEAPALAQENKTAM